MSRGRYLRRQHKPREKHLSDHSRAIVRMVIAGRAMAESYERMLLMVLEALEAAEKDLAHFDRLAATYNKGDASPEAFERTMSGMRKAKYA